MTIGTSLGGHYQDEHHYQARDYKSDIERSVNKQVEGTTMDVDPDLIRDPVETSAGGTSGLDEMGVKEMQMLMSTGEDPGNIYNDKGEIVDYDLRQGDPRRSTDNLPKEALKEYQGYLPKFNEIDELADRPPGDWGIPDLPTRKTDEQIRKEAEEMNK